MDKKELKTTKDEGRVKILKAYLYKSHYIVLRQIGKDYFEYITEYNGQIYSSYIIIKPRKGEKKLKESDIQACSQIVGAGAEATLDELLGHQMDKQTQEYLEVFEANREKFEKEQKENNGKKD